MSERTIKKTVSEDLEIFASKEDILRGLRSIGVITEENQENMTGLELFFDVPGGGCYSGEAIEIDHDDGLRVKINKKWVENHD